MKLTLNKFKKILHLKKKFNFNDFDLITNYGLFSGDSNLYKILVLFNLIKEVQNIKGDIIELGVHNGNTSLLIKKILDIFKINKKLYLLDHFKGLTNFQKKDTLWSLRQRGKYVASKKKILSFINFFRFKKIFIIDKDAVLLKPNFFNHKVKFALAYFDMDLYLPTLKGLQAIDKNMNKGSYIVFDQGTKKNWAERLAINNFLKNNKKYKKIIINKKRQPDVFLKKIQN
jgi:hypothetical protein